MLTEWNQLIKKDKFHLWYRWSVTLWRHNIINLKSSIWSGGQLLRPEIFDADSWIPDSKSKWLHWQRMDSTQFHWLHRRGRYQLAGYYKSITYPLEFTSLSPKQLRTKKPFSNYKGFSRSLTMKLATRRQRSGETIDEYLKNLNATFRRYQPRGIARKAFETPLSVAWVGLETLGTLALRDAAAQASSLESAQKCASVPSCNLSL